MTSNQRAAAARHRKLAKMAEKKAAALKKAHEREHASLNKALAAVDRKFEPKLEKLAREIAEHESKAQEHHANAAHIHHAHGK